MNAPLARCLRHAVPHLATFLVLGLSPLHAGEWVPARGPEGGSPQYLSLSPVRPGLAFTRVLLTHYRSTDGGRTWEPNANFEGGPSRMAYDPFDDSRIDAWGTTGLFRSDDGGVTWSERPIPPADGYTSSVLGLAYDTTRPGRAYVLVRVSGGVFEDSNVLFRTDDGGQTWIPVHDFGFFGAWEVVLPKGSSDVLVSSLDAIVRSTDGGSTFDAVRSGSYVYVLESNPNRNGRVFGTDGEVLLISRDSGQTWVEKALPIELGGGIDVAGSAPERIVFSAGWLGVWISEDEGRSWRAVTGLPASIWAAPALVAPWNEDLVLVADLDGSGIHRSVDAGASWRSSNEGLRSPVDRLILHPDPGASMLVVASNQLYSSAEHGDRWEHLLTLSPSSYEPRVAVCPSDPSRIAALSFHGRLHRPLLRTSSDAGRTWQRVETPTTDRVLTWVTLTGDGTLLVGDGIERHFVARDDSGAWIAGSLDQPYEVRADPTHPSRVYAIDGVGVQRSTDYGLSWEASGLSRPAVDLAIHPGHPQRLYAATHRHSRVGYAYSVDGGRSWSQGRTASGLAPMRHLRITLDAVRPERIALLNRERIPYRSIDGGRTFEQLRDQHVPFQLTDIAFDPRDGKLWGTDPFRRLYYYED